MTLYKFISINVLNKWLFLSFMFCDGQHANFTFIPPLDTRHKLNVHKTFRRRAGNLLKVLSACNLRIVSWLLELMKKDDLTIY